MFRNIRIRFSLYGLLIVLLQSLPNIIWVLWPPTPNAFAGNASSSPFIEYGEHILGVAIVVLLLFLVSSAKRQKIMESRWGIASLVFIAMYWLCWMLYFAGVQPYPVIYAMVILPPFAFFSAGIAVRVWLISVASTAFLVFHILVALENFPIMAF